MAATSPIKTSADMAARSVFPAAIMIFTVLVMILVAVHWSSERTNKATTAMQRTFASQAFSASLTRLELSLAEVSADRDNLSGRLLSLVSNPEPLEAFDVAGIAGETTAPEIWAQRAAAALKGGPQSALAAVSTSLQRLRGEAGSAGAGKLATPLPDTRLVVENGAVAIVCLTAISPGESAARPGVAFGVRFLDRDFLEALANRFGGTQLRVTVGEDIAKSETSIPLFARTGEVTAALTWAADLPGDQVIRGVLPVVLLGALVLAVFSVLAFVQVRRILSEMLDAEARAKHMAGLDPLTGLSNRISFMDRVRTELTRVERGLDGIAVIFVDLDKFKEVNDTLGHAAGDRLLVAVSRRLTEQLRGSDALARLGGDEFAVVQTQVKSPRDAEALARRLLEAVHEPFDLEGAEAYVGLSMGIALSPQNGASAEDLVRFADVALYRSKAEGRNRFSFFEDRMDEAVRVRKLVEDELRAAIDDGQLQLAYQPQVSVDGSRIVSVEALVRWNHPVQGLISPARFIPIAEERGLIIPLGEWVLRRACEEAKAWPGISIAVNVSAVQFKHRDFVASVSRVLDETGFDAARLEIELTESVVVDDADAAELAMMELRAMGVRLALDDFGTGYSSLIYLRRFAFDKIKIDKSFLESMEATGESAILVHSVVHLGRALGLTVTAEGVETDEQHRFLQAVGCHLLQGYYFSKPVPSREISRMLEIGKVGPALAA